VQLGAASFTIFQPDSGDSLLLAPTSAPVNLSQPCEIANAGALGDGFYVSDLVQDFKAHSDSSTAARSFVKRVSSPDQEEIGFSKK